MIIMEKASFNIVMSFLTSFDDILEDKKDKFGEAKNPSGKNIFHCLILN